MRFLPLVLSCRPKIWPGKVNKSAKMIGVPGQVPRIDGVFDPVIAGGLTRTKERLIDQEREIASNFE